jgi:hypothetical protein
MQGQIDCVTVDSLARYLKRRDAQARFVELSLS